MKRFSEIAHDIESQYDPDFDLDVSKTAPPMRYIEHRLLELCETLVDENHHLEMNAYHAKAKLAEAETEVKRLTALVDALKADNKNLFADLAAMNAHSSRLAALR